MAAPRDHDFLSFVLDQLESLEGLCHRRMFGATGLYLGERFFGIADGGRLYFRTNDTTRPEYEALGMKAFAPRPDQTLENYFEVPVDVLEDDARLCDWARRAAAAAPARTKGKRV